MFEKSREGATARKGLPYNKIKAVAKGKRRTASWFTHRNAHLEGASDPQELRAGRKAGGLPSRPEHPAFSGSLLIAFSPKVRPRPAPPRGPGHSGRGLVRPPLLPLRAPPHRPPHRKKKQSGSGRGGCSTAAALEASSAPVAPAGPRIGVSAPQQVRTGHAVPSRKLEPAEEGALAAGLLRGGGARSLPAIPPPADCPVRGSAPPGDARPARLSPVAPCGHTFGCLLSSRRGGLSLVVPSSVSILPRPSDSLFARKWFYSGAGS